MEMIGKRSYIIHFSTTHVHLLLVECPFANIIPARHCMMFLQLSLFIDQLL